MPVFFRYLLLLVITAGGFTVSSVHVEATVDLHKFETESQRERYLTLIDELRCPKCQNQNLAGSNSQIATDLRRELHRLLLEGKTDREIKDFMVARYGDFVLYKPPLQSSTVVLWLLPLVLLLVGAVALMMIVRQRRSVKNATTEILSTDEVSKLDSILNETHEKSP